MTPTQSRRVFGFRRRRGATAGNLTQKQRFFELVLDVASSRPTSRPAAFHLVKRSSGTTRFLFHALSATNPDVWQLARLLRGISQRQRKILRRRNRVLLIAALRCMCQPERVEEREGGGGGHKKVFLLPVVEYRAIRLGEASCGSTAEAGGSHVASCPCEVVNPSHHNPICRLDVTGQSEASPPLPPSLVPSFACCCASG